MTIFAPTNVKVTVDANKGLYQEAANTAEIVVNSNVPLTLESAMTLNEPLTVNASSSLGPVSEAHTEYGVAGGGATVNFDCTDYHIFRHVPPGPAGVGSNYTANFVNLNLLDNRATSLTIVIYQLASPGIPTAVQIEGVAQTINWQANVVPSGTANRKDVVSFSIINAGGTYTVLGQLVSF